MKRFLLVLLPLALLLLAGALWLRSLPAGLRGVTGEEELAAQVRGLGHLLSGRLRPYPAMEPLRPVRHAGLYPFGINTFLQTESEPDKVERSLDMIAEGGFRWIRQEFPWEDLEIHRDDWYLDLRDENEIRNAWTKYDRIVDLAEARGIEIIVRLSNPPSWSRLEGDARGAKAPPDDLELYGDYVEAVVSRYRGRLRYYQIWNEPNCCEEWGTRSVSPEAYTEMLRVAYTRAKAADPDAVILTAPLAPTIKMEPVAADSVPALNDFLFLQRMYDAGAKDFFDVLAVQDYGLYSGPSDRRMRPRVLNYSRPIYIRDIMLRNGDGEKAIWISEMGWNASPAEVDPNFPFGYTPEERRGPYLVEAFERQQREWPWMGVTTTWFFKRASDEEADEAFYYFQLVAPDFTPLPAWEAVTDYIHTLRPTLFRGYHQEEHWVLRHDLAQGAWPLVEEQAAIFEQVALGASGEHLRFTVEGQRLSLVLHPGTAGELQVQVGETTRHFTLRPGGILDEQGRTVQVEATDVGKKSYHLPLGPLPEGLVSVELTVVEGEVAMDGVIVE